jgi:hypothetical protein
MPLMNEAMSKEDYDRKEQGLPLAKKKRVVVSEPNPPVVENEITMKDIPESFVLASARRQIVKNKDGVTFIGFNILIYTESLKGKKSNEKVQQEIEGWMNEGEFLIFLRTYRNYIDQNVISW